MEGDVWSTSLGWSIGDIATIRSATSRLAHPELQPSEEQNEGLGRLICSWPLSLTLRHVRASGLATDHNSSTIVVGHWQPLLASCLPCTAIRTLFFKAFCVWRPCFSRVSFSFPWFLQDSIASRDNLWVLGSTSIQVWCSSWKIGHFSCKIPFFW